MNDPTDFSDERLNAFVDGELDEHEREAILAAIALDADLGRRLCELRTAKDLVRHAYARVPAPRRRSARRDPWWRAALAAGVVLATGVIAGWYGHRAVAVHGTEASAFARAGDRSATAPARVLIHLDDSEAERMEEALDLAETYLARAARARVEIVVNNSGLELLRERSTPHAKRIRALAARHETLAFVACGNAIARYRGAGLDVTLVPEARVARTAIEHIVERVQHGWTYLKI